MSKFIELLRTLNRKERFYLVGFALDKPSFTLGDDFRSLIQREFEEDVPVNAFVAMDYHFSWLYAAAVLSGTSEDRPFPSGGGIERGNQEDIDLLVAFDRGNDTTVLILEAKGVTGWSNKQLRSKLGRLTSIFGSDSEATRFPHLHPKFAILSPFRPSRLKVQGWPNWMKDESGRPHWIRLPTPPNLEKVTRCDADGHISARGGYWKVVADRVAAGQARLTQPPETPAGR
jgi:hypothetical protein